MNVLDLVYIALALAFFVVSDLALDVVGEGKAERRR